MALFYNLDGTVSEVVVNYINSASGAVTSTVTPPTIRQSFEASASNAIINAYKPSVASSHIAYGLGYPNSVRTNAGNTYLSSTTIKKTYSTSSYSVLNPNNPNRNNKGTNYHITGSINNIFSGSLQFVSASYSDVKNTLINSSSIVGGRIAKIAIPFNLLQNYVKPNINNIQNITVLNYNGVVESLNKFNTISSSIENDVTSNFAILFVSAAKNDMGTLKNNNLNVSLNTQQLLS